MYLTCMRREALHDRQLILKTLFLPILYFSHASSVMALLLQQQLQVGARNTQQQAWKQAVVLSTLQASKTGVLEAQA